MPTELDAQGRRLLAVSGKHIRLDLHAIGTRIRRYEREEEASGFRARGEGIEGYANIGKEPGDHGGGGGKERGLSLSRVGVSSFFGGREDAMTYQQASARGRWDSAIGVVRLIRRTWATMSVLEISCRID